MESKFLDRQRRSPPELPASQDDEHDHRQRHREREPLKRFVTKARRWRHRACYQSRIIWCPEGLRGWRYGDLHARALHLDLADACQDALLHAVREGRILEILGHFFAIR